MIEVVNMKKDGYSINKTEMGKRIREARKKARLTQENLGEACNVSDVAISRYENGQVTPRLITLVAIASATQTPIEWFFDMPINQNNMDEYNAALHKIHDLCLSLSLADLEYVITFLDRISNH